MFPTHPGKEHTHLFPLKGGKGLFLSVKYLAKDRYTDHYISITLHRGQPAGRCGGGWLGKTYPSRQDSNRHRRRS